MQYTSPLVFFTSLLVSWFAVPGVILVAKRKSLFDKPSETRKIHTKSIPNLGGVAIFLGFYFSILLYQVFCDSVELSSLCASSVLLFFVALKDDFVGTTPRTRLLYQTLIALIVITIGQIYFIHIPFFESFGTFQKTINILASLIFIMGMINAVNFIDGIDGLAATLSLFVFLVFAYVFYLYKETSYSLTALALSGSTLGFLLYNTHPAKIFMGDSGSTFLGLFWAILAIKLNNMSPLQYGTIPVSNPPALAFALMIVPIMDMISVILIRLWLKCSPFKADNRHTHHRLLYLGLSQKAVTAVLLAFNLFMTGFSFLICSFNTFFSVLTLSALAGIFELVLIHCYLKKKNTTTEKP